MLGRAADCVRFGERASRLPLGGAGSVRGSLRNGWVRALTVRIRSLGRMAAFLIAAALVTTGLTVSAMPTSASALTASDFDAGNIIPDSLFYDSSALSSAQIQSFLDSKIGACSNGLCLNVLTDTVASRGRLVSDATGAVRCQAFEGGSLSAAEIIFRVQVACGISAKVILVTLEKEQGLVDKNAPSQAALDRAMGFACPDTAPCATTSLGFGNQVYSGSLQLKTYKASQFGVQPGVRNILWSPNNSCGSSNGRSIS